MIVCLEIIEKIMGRKCSAGGCRSNYANEVKIPVYGFPLKNRDELLRWLAAVPNVVEPEQVTRNMGICALHWPDSAEFITVNGKRRPKDPPSLFSTPKSFTRQTVPTTSRNTDNRLSLENRSAIPDELGAFNENDKINNFEKCVSGISDFLRTVPGEYHCLQSSTYVHIVSFNDSMFLQPKISIRIESRMAVSAFHYTTRVSITDLLGFQYKLERWSQLENIINRVKNSSVSVASEVKDFVLRIEDVDDTDQSENLSFLLEQLSLMVTPSHGRRYSSRTMNVAMNLYLNSKSCYKMLRSENILALPAPKTLQGNIGNFNSMGTDADAEQVSKLVFSHVGQSPNCFIVFDEIYVKPSLRLRGGHIMGYSADRPEELARTILALMVRLIFPAKKSLSSFVIKFFPIFSLKADFLTVQLKNVIQLVQKAGGVCMGLMSDNHASNRSSYNSLRSDSNVSFRTEHPTDSSRTLFLLHDPVHLMKCIRNNWQTEKNQELSLEVSDESSVVGRFSEVKALYEKEKMNIVKRTTLTRVAVNPTNIEKVKVAPVLQVFHEKTVAALRQDGNEDTATFVDCILKMWKILNNKSTKAHILLNDSDRMPIRSGSDQQLPYLEKCQRLSRTCQGAEDVIGSRH